MIVVALTLLVATAAFASLAVLGHSLARAAAAFGELRRALNACEDIVVARVRIVEQVRRPQLTLVSSASGPARGPNVPLPRGLRAAA